MSTFQERFHEAMVDGFGDHVHGYHDSTDLYTLGDAEAVDDFFDYLQAEFSGELTDAERPHIRYVNQAWAWAWAAHEAEEADIEEQSDVFKDDPHWNSFGWKDKLLPIQRAILRLSYFVGLGGFGYGMYLTVKVKNTKLGGLFTGLGMFIAVQMVWGMQTFFNFLEKRDSNLLKKMGYPTLFWAAMTFTLLIDFLAAGLIWEFVLGT